MGFTRWESTTQRYQYIVLWCRWPMHEFSISILFHIIPRMVKKLMATGCRLISAGSVTAEIPQSA
jgi:hypothetical protein